MRANLAIPDTLGSRFRRLDRRDIKGLLADSTPRGKLILSEQHNVGRGAVTGSLMRYGRYTAYSSASRTIYGHIGTIAVDQTFAPKWLLDLAANYNVGRWTFTVGADDALDTCPDKVIAISNNEGTLHYSVYAPFGYKSAYAYGKVAYRW